MTTPHSRLNVQHLQKSFKKRQVVKNFSLEIESGEVVGLLGPNGAGKTTSFYMIVGLIAADGGSVMLDDREIRHLPIHERARLGLGYLPQEASIFRKMTVAQNIRAILEIRLKDKKQIDAELERLLTTFDEASSALRCTVDFARRDGSRLALSLLLLPGRDADAREDQVPESPLVSCAPGPGPHPPRHQSRSVPEPSGYAPPPAPCGAARNGS